MSHLEFGKVRCLSSLPLMGDGRVGSDVGRQASSKIGRRTTSNWLYITLFAFVSWSVLSRAGSRRGSDCRPTLTAKRQRPGRRTSGASFCWPRPPSARRWRRACPEGRMIYCGRGFNFARSYFCSFACLYECLRVRVRNLSYGGGRRFHLLHIFAQSRSE